MLSKQETERKNWLKRQIALKEQRITEITISTNIFTNNGARFEIEDLRQEITQHETEFKELIQKEKQSNE